MVKEYSALLKTYISLIPDVEAFNANYAAKGIELDATGSYYLIEFQKEMATDKDIAIYDVSTKNITFYKLADGNCTIVK